MRTMKLAVTRKPGNLMNTANIVTNMVNMKDLDSDRKTQPSCIIHSANFETSVFDTNNLFFENAEQEALF